MRSGIRLLPPILRPVLQTGEMIRVAQSGGPSALRLEEVTRKECAVPIIDKSRGRKGIVWDSLAQLLVLAAAAKDSAAMVISWDRKVSPSLDCWKAAESTWT